MRWNDRYAICIHDVRRANQRDGWPQGRNAPNCHYEEGHCKQPDEAIRILAKRRIRLLRAPLWGPRNDSIIVSLGLSNALHAMDLLTMTHRIALAQKPGTQRGGPLGRSRLY